MSDEVRALERVLAEVQSAVESRQARVAPILPAEREARTVALRGTAALCREGEQRSLRLASASGAEGRDGAHLAARFARLLRVLKHLS